MPSTANSPFAPFIPPLPEDIRDTPPQHRPVIPPMMDRQASNGASPGWGMPPAIERQASNGAPPGWGQPNSYYAAPVGLPQSGLTEDWLGFGGGAGGGGHPSSAWSGHPQLHPHHPGTPWAGPGGMPMTGYSAYQPPLPGYGMPPPTMGYGVAPMPGAYPGMGYPGTPWQGSGFGPPTPGSGMGMPPMGYEGAYEAQTNLGRLVNNDDLQAYTRFAPGKNYGPVLDPLQVAAVGARPQLNPLIAPPPEDPQERAHLTWNMLFETARAKRSDDSRSLSWSKGRDEPATFPRVTSLRLLCRTFPWTVDIKAHRRELGVTCGDVIDQLCTFLMGHVSGSEYNASSNVVKRKVTETYQMNRSATHDVPGGRLGEGLKRIDWLGTDTMFEGVEFDPEYVRRRLGFTSRGKDLPCVWVLNCGKRWVLSDEERREMEEMERRRPSRSNSRRHSRNVDHDHD
ncbi:hypothetical protein BD410DRAFT_777654 [Rickenella mellea]|uniref:DUF6699 domain-containing protein n=1 Tax=Rickenella mellea TaxID=50990 RepID=A0A4Y7PL74_9AGAM|nr:hypothetical protein BD410DRAFT_777654 [Rickenella mellea]